MVWLAGSWLCVQVEQEAAGCQGQENNLSEDATDFSASLGGGREQLYNEPLHSQDCGNLSTAQHTGNRSSNNLPGPLQVNYAIPS